MAGSIPWAAAHFLGYSYTESSSENVVPVGGGCLPPGLVRRPGEPARVDCSTFAAAVVVYATSGEVVWDAEAYSDLQIMGDNIWSPVDCWLRHGIGRKVDSEAQGWAVYQGWGRTGHQWFYNGAMGVRVHSSTGRGPVWEKVTWESFSGQFGKIEGVELGR